MKTLFCFTLILISLPTYSFNEAPVKDFHRLVTLDKDHNLMVVKIKGTDFWVTPGLYSKVQKNIHAGLKAIAEEYGISISYPVLKGRFKLIRDKLNSYRYFYTAVKTEGSPKLPDNIEAVKWLPINEATKLITFPHINILLKKIMSDTETTWCATVERYKEQDQYKAKLIEEFKPLNECVHT